MADVRLIDANELRKNLSSRYMNELYPDWRTLPELSRMRIEMLAKEFRFAIDHAPTVEAVPVVRCRECIFRGQWDICPMCVRVYMLDKKAHLDCTEDDGFCHMGAKMTGGADNG